MGGDKKPKRHSQRLEFSNQNFVEDEQATPVAAPRSDDEDETPTAQAPIMSKKNSEKVSPEQRPASLPSSSAVTPPSATTLASITTPSTIGSRYSVPRQPPSTPIPPSRNRKRKVTELKCTEIRWFHQELKVWVPFNGRDSINLEIAYRREKKIEIDDATLSLIEDPEETLEEDGANDTECDLGVSTPTSEKDEKEENPMVTVLSGQYRVNISENRIEPIYWKDDSREIRRGTWFTPDNQPLDMVLSDHIERAHLQYFRGQTIPEGTTVFSKNETSSKPVLAELHLETCDIKWSSVIDISVQQRGNAIFRYIWTKATPLRRGYEKEALWEDSSAEISHLILVVHGIGQKGYENLIATNANQVSDNVVRMMENYFPDEKTRPMFLPVEWRSSLVLDNGITENLTIPKMISMRASLNSTAMDVMYYQSPLFRTEIVRAVVKQLNRVYKLFIANNPNFKGPVSVFGHSLGSVICYDILNQYSPLLLYDKYVTKSIDEYLEKSKSRASEEARKALESLKIARQQIREHLDGGIEKLLVTKEEVLDFKVKYLFAVGSPLGVFLAMRGAGHSDLLPSAANVERVFNIFHPYDPVAYRLEPFFAPEYRHIRPVKIFANTDGRGKASYEQVPLDVYKHYLKKLKNQKSKKKSENGDRVDARSGGDEDLEEEDECESDEEIKSGCSSPRSMTPPPTDREPPAKDQKAKKGWFSFGASSQKKASAVNLANSQGSTSAEPIEYAKEAEQDLPLPERILGGCVRVPKRIDFQLQPGLTDKSYWSVLKSHFAYWTNADMALFLANTMYLKDLAGTKLSQ